MSYRKRLMPLSSSMTQRRPVARFDGFPAAAMPDTEIRDIGVLRSWLLYDSILRTEFGPRRINWNAVMGLGLATLVSASIWAGVALALVQIWK
jgi:hypothetical protein